MSFEDIFTFVCQQCIDAVTSPFQRNCGNALQFFLQKFNVFVVVLGIYSSYQALLGHNAF